LLFTLGIMIASFIIAFLIVNTFYHQQLREENDAKNMQIAENIANYIESEPDIDLENFLTTEANVGYKIYVVNESGESNLYGIPFREENLAEKDIELVLNNERYHGMRDLPKETFVTGFFSDEMANTVGVPFTYNNEQYALFLRPNI